MKLTKMGKMAGDRLHAFGIAGAVVALCFAAFDASAVEYFVLKDGGSDSYDGLAAEWDGTHGPKQSIQAAVDLADGNGTVVTILPGVYDNGGGETDAGSYPQANRVVVRKSNVTLRSSTGKASDVHIVGARSTAEGNDHGIGEGAMRCLAANSSASGLVIENITFRDGCGIRDAGGKNRGGGIYGNGDVTIIDCVVSNCACLRGGGIHNARVHSSLIVGNYASTSYGTAMNQCSAANCLIIGNKGSSSSASVMSYMGTVVNCTVVDNATKGICNGISGTSRFFNILASGNGNDGSSGTSVDNVTVLSNSVIVGSGSYSIEGDSVKSAVWLNQCYAPAVDDYIPLTIGDCVGRGRGEYLRMVPIPSGYTYHDMHGVEVPTSGAINAGAFQTAVTPAAARIDFNVSVQIDGFPNVAKEGGWMYPTNWPVTYRFKPVHANPYALYSKEERLTDKNYYQFRYPMYDGWTPFTPNPDVTATNTIGLATNRQTFYADAENGNDDYDGTSPTWEGGESLVGPKKTLQAAVDLVTETYGIVYAAPGVYDEGGAEYDSVSNRVVINNSVGIIASGGPGSATIKGAPDPVTGGLGPNAMRCVRIATKYSFIQGFVLTGGYTADDEEGSHRGAAYYNGVTEPNVLDCIVSNNVARHGIGAGCTAHRTKFIDNIVTNYVMRSCIAESCLFSGNTILNSAPAPVSASSYIFGCTLDCNGSRDGGGTTSYAYGSVLFNASVYGYYGGTSTGNAICNAGCFANAAERDYRLGALAPACGAVSAADIATGNFYRYVTADIDGRAPIYYADGSMDAGAIQMSPKLPMYAVDGGGCAIEMLGGESLSNCVTAVAELTAVATGTKEGPFLGFEVNGEMQPFTSTTQVFTVSAEMGAGTLVKAIYGTNWYVNAVSGDDGDFGSSAETARRTLASVAQYAKSGDVIHAAAGVYDEGDMLHTSAKYAGGAPTVKSRVWLKDGVTLESESGPENTFIVGAAATVEDRNGYDNGSNAVRCVVLETDTLIKGFTLTGGHTGSLLQSDGSSARVDDCAGAAVLGANNTSSRVEDCIISNNVAGLCAAGFACSFNRCRIINNKGISRAAAGRSCRYYRSIIDGNYGANQLEVFAALNSCTVGSNAWTIAGGTGAAVVYNSSSYIRNSIVLGRVVNGNGTNRIRGTNSVFRAGCGVLDEDAVGCIITNYAAIAFDEGYRPKIGANVAIDMADETLSEASMITDVDVYGAQGVMNGVRDIGAAEADWRGVYAADIGRPCVVDEVSPEVCETEDKTVFLPSGAISGTFGNAGGSAMTCMVKVRVTGNGTLTAYSGDEVLGTFTAADGVQEQLFRVASAPWRYMFAYEPGENDDGGAELLNVARYAGTVFSIR